MRAGAPLPKPQPVDTTAPLKTEVVGDKSDVH